MTNMNHDPTSFDHVFEFLFLLRLCSDHDPTDLIRPCSNRGQRRREVGIFPTLFRLGSDPDPTVFEVNTVGSGRCSREVRSGSEQVLEQRAITAEEEKLVLPKECGGARGGTDIVHG